MKNLQAGQGSLKSPKQENAKKGDTRTLRRLLMAVRPKPYHLKLFFSNKFTYAQVVRTVDGHIVACASTIENIIRENVVQGKPKSEKPSSVFVGTMLAERSKEKGVQQVHFEMKHRKKYHGKLKD